jgi:hypothetical protein
LRIAFFGEAFSLRCTGILFFAAFVLFFYNGEYKRMHLEHNSSHHHGLLPTVEYSVEEDDDDTTVLLRN